MTTASRAVVMAIVLAALSIFWIRSISGAYIEADAIETLDMAINLAHNGVISSRIPSDRSIAPSPTMYREPLPAVSSALIIRLMDLSMGTAERGEYFEGVRAKYLKYQNVFWAAVMTLSLFGLLLLMTNSFAAAVIGSVLANVPIKGLYDPHLDTLYSEPIAKALFALSAFLLVLGIVRDSRKPLVFAAIAFGALTLTKAAFLYVFVGLVICFVLVTRLMDAPHPRKVKRSWSDAAKDGLILLLVFSVVVVPWMWRNHAEFGTSQIAQRSGLALFTRALKNQVTPTEYVGCFYVWAPNSLARSLMAKITGFTPQDLEKGGPLQRLNRSRTSNFSQEDIAAEREGRPDKALSFYREGRAWRVKLEKEYRAQGFAHPDIEADRDLRQRGMALIVEHPWRHIAFIPPVLWRGALPGFIVLLVALVYALRHQRQDMTLVVLPALGLIGLCALSTPFETRFSWPVMPVAIVSGWLLLYWIGKNMLTVDVRTKAN